MSYVRVSILGVTTGGEVWSVNPVYDPTGEFPGGVNQVALDAAATAIANLTLPSSLLSSLSTLMGVTGCRLEVRDDTTDALIGISIANRATPVYGGVAPSMPPQAAIVMSLRTNTPGASGRGRVYWPFLGYAITSAGRISSIDVTAVLGAFKTYSASIAGALATAFPTIGFDLAVRSKQTKTTPHVVRIQAGNVVDTQRRRRDHLPEAYTTVTVP